MAPFIVLLAVTLVARSCGEVLSADWLASWPQAVRLGLAAMLLLTASAHFVEPRRTALVEMVPPDLPSPAVLVSVTGALELLGAAGLMIDPLAPGAGIGLAVLFCLLFPANVRAARAGVGLRSVPLGARTAMQVAFVAASLFAGLG